MVSDSTSRWLKVTKEKLAEYISSYPRVLERDVFITGEPASVAYYDRTLDDAVVATYYPGSPEEDPSYRIRTDVP